jgi:sulfite reductase (ferredoxin)
MTTSDDRRTKLERIKETSRGLRGTIGAELRDGSPRFSPDSVQLLKFHGIYQQDDRDARQELKARGEGRRTIFMIRTKNPGGGPLTPEQWAIIDRASDLHGDGTLRLTTRQDVQFHGVGKDHLRDLIRLLDSELISTYGACGDGTRNTCACPVSAIRRGAVFDGPALARRIALHLGFRSTAHYEIWLRDEETGRDTPFTPVTEEPLYGRAYLPRKFKIGVAMPDDNCVEVHTHDVGIVPLLVSGGLRGFNVLAGGGLGSTHAKPGTYPRLADPIARVEPDEDRLLEILTGILTLQRDFGGRADRRHARLKYLIDDRGLAWFRDELQRRLGHRLADPDPLPLTRSAGHLGVHEQRDGRYYLGLFIENGRVADRGARRLKTGLREVIRTHRPNVRITPGQDLLLSDLTRVAVDRLRDDLARHGIDAVDGFSALRRRSMACPALPTCGLAITEAERFLPQLVKELEDRGYGAEPLVLRMSGCPNACSRPPVAEIGLMGRSLNSFAVYVGGSPAGTRLAVQIGDNVPAAALVTLIGRLLDGWRAARRDAEAFGDYCHRVGAERLQPLVAEVAGHRAVAGPAPLPPGEPVPPPVSDPELSAGPGS